MLTLLLVGATMGTTLTQGSHNWFDDALCEELSHLAEDHVFEDLAFTNLPLDMDSSGGLGFHDWSCWFLAYRDPWAYVDIYGEEAFDRGDFNSDGYLKKEDFYRAQSFWKVWHDAWAGVKWGNWTIVQGEQRIDAEDLNEVLFKWGPDDGRMMAHDLNAVLFGWGWVDDYYHIEPPPDIVCIGGTGCDTVPIPEPASWFLVLLGLWRIARWRQVKYRQRSEGIDSVLGSADLRGANLLYAKLMKRCWAV